MSNILHITSSIRGSDSVSGQVSAKMAETLAAKSGATITLRDLSANDLPFVDAAMFEANGTPPEDRTAQQNELAAAADTLVAELLAADTVVLGVPMYNFAAPATVKAWADLVARAGTTFRYTPGGPEGLLTGKKAYIALATGGTPIGSDVDYLTGWLKQFMSFLGIEVVETITADGIMGADGADKIAAALEQAANV